MQKRRNRETHLFDVTQKSMRSTCISEQNKTQQNKTKVTQTVWCFSVATRILLICSAAIATCWKIIQCHSGNIRYSFVLSHQINALHRVQHWKSGPETAQNASWGIYLVVVVPRYTSLDWPRANRSCSAAHASFHFTRSPSHPMRDIVVPCSPSSAR